jgi:hypothetical protein
VSSTLPSNFLLLLRPGRFGSERVTPELIADVYNKELKLLHPMVQALRDNDIERLAMFSDIAPIGLGDLLNNVQRKLRAKTSAAFKVRPTDPTFVPRIATSLVAAGFGEEEAIQAAESVAVDGQAKNLLQGTQAALSSLTAIKPVSRARSKLTKQEPFIPPDLEARPGDYRRAVLKAHEAGTSIYEQLQKLGMAQPLDQLLELS